MERVDSNVPRYIPVLLLEGKGRDVNNNSIGGDLQYKNT